ncbi:MAG: hypothetical protein HY952_11150 [Elusimicrobia bacterium]|nr:hypothetical protein [Elusimicrobiota bacterium]
MSHTVLFGLLSVALQLCSRAVYFTSIFRGRTRPHAFSWLIWAAISGIGFAAQVAEGAGPGSWARGFSAATCLVLAVLGYYKGEKNITRGDWLTLAVAFSAIPLWVATKTPVWSVFIVCIIDTIGYTPTIRKSWHKPGEETPVSYFISTACAASAILAVENYTLSTWLYSAVLVATNSAMGAIILARRSAVRSAAAA